MFQQQQGFDSLLKEGSKTFAGVDDNTMKNIEALKNLATLVNSSMGPNGAKKLIINHLGKIFVSGDATTIVQEMEVQHPAAKLVVMAAEAQRNECGDFSNFVLSFAGALAGEAEKLVREGVPMATILSGLQVALDKTVTIFTDSEETIVYKVTDPRDASQLRKIIASTATNVSMAPCMVELIANSIAAMMPADAKKFNPDNVRTAKVPGKSAEDSHDVDGCVVTRDTLGVVKKVKATKVAVFANGLQSESTETTGNVVLTSAAQLKGFTASEEREMEDFVVSLKEAGVGLVLSGGTVSDLAIHYLNKHGLMGLRITSKFELRRLCRTLQASSLLSIQDRPTPEELGYVDVAEVVELGSAKMTNLRVAESPVRTIVLRGATPSAMAELERAVDVAVSSVRSAVANDAYAYCAGAGGCDMLLASLMREFAATLTGLEQYTVEAFARALECVPKVLASNAGLDSIDSMALLYSAQSSGKRTAGLDLKNAGKLVDVLDSSILDHAWSKLWAFRFSVDAVITVLKIDQIIMAKQAGGPKPQ